MECEALGPGTGPLHRPPELVNLWGTVLGKYSYFPSFPGFLWECLECRMDIFMVTWACKVRSGYGS